MWSPASSIRALLAALPVFSGFIVNIELPITHIGSVPFYDPRVLGGSMLDNAGGGYGEPLNVIISGTSSPEVLTENGFIKFALALGFARECLDIHLGAPMPANLGDGNGWVNQTIELRHDYAIGGTCAETIFGGNHLRLFVQNGTEADSGALFLAVSKEEDLEEHHTISPNGYDRGRTIRIPFGSEKHASIAKQVIEVDRELQPQAVKRTLSVEDRTLVANFETLTIRLSRLTVNAFLENVDLVVRTIGEFGENAECGTTT
ncbi:uncharacterized protein FIBRA_02129 [Fibroporia radiculosa]|uniref:Uncharacterized protein n=1 Tax=Fibroporia radiculosa TaxID=599839 RepID=J4HUE7_9APHY|nr:uncharacterized protein FIBRA_02129 [Fibroporia radiculosa]CCM00102.1 predicted protein [Fibroporia radiculosa]